MKVSWCLAQIKPQSDKIADRNLRRQGFSTFLPRVSATRKERGRFVSRDIPLFPGYIFVALDENSGGHRKINSTLGITRLVSFAGVPAAVPNEMISALKSRCDAEDRLVESPKPAVGDQVTLVQGPFAEFVATVERLDPDQRVWVLIDLMGRRTRVAVDTTYLRAS